MKGPEAEAQTRVAGDPNWVESKRAIVATGLKAPGVASKFRMYDDYLQKMENALERHAWLAGATFSLADIAMTPYVNRLDMLGMSDMWVGTRPRLTEWFERIKSRPSFKPSLLDMCPADLTADLKTFGTRSWPDVKRLLAA